MSISTLFGCPVAVSPVSSLAVRIGGMVQPSPRTSSGGIAIECSSRPKKKATAHHMKTRPKKTRPWDIRRKPTVYPPLPLLPPDWTLVSGGEESADAALPPLPPSELQAPPAS
ncbi:hypothetical protein SAY87_011967 [Trapa incisa]|uniref:50S ribosomal protein 6, chloroplastic n=1 Tax=Trapa incisa TaxID=236973 RepID=A0AAN7GGB5_9MYRT|nr:hypothetical protein SAY87_011967 [Trapa incisa]